MAQGGNSTEPTIEEPDDGNGIIELTRGYQVPRGSASYNLRDDTSQTYVNVNHATNMQVNGKMTVYMGDTSGKKKKKRNKKPLTTSTEPVTTNQLLSLKDEIGRDWRDLGRRFNFTEGYLDQVKMDYPDDSCELNYQILLRWQRENIDDATQANLAQIFKKMHRGDLADLLVEEDQKL